MNSNNTVKTKDKIIKVLAEELFKRQNCPPGMNVVFLCKKYKECTFKKEIAINCWIDWAERQVNDDKE